MKISSRFLNYIEASSESHDLNEFVDLLHEACAGPYRGYIKASMSRDRPGNWLILLFEDESGLVVATPSDTAEMFTFDSADHLADLEPRLYDYSKAWEPIMQSILTEAKKKAKEVSDANTVH